MLELRGERRIWELGRGNRSERLLLRSHDQQPKDGGELGHKYRLEVAEESAGVIRSEEPDDADDQPRDAVQQEPLAEPAR